MKKITMQTVLVCAILLLLSSMIGSCKTAAVKTETKEETKEVQKEKTEIKTDYDIKKIDTDNRNLSTDILDFTFGEPDSTGKVTIKRAVITTISDKGKQVKELENKTVTEQKAKTIAQKQVILKAKTKENSFFYQLFIDYWPYLIIFVVVLFVILDLKAFRFKI